MLVPLVTENARPAVPRFTMALEESNDAVAVNH